MRIGGDVWVYRPATHKSKHRGRRREIVIGPQAQTHLGPFLLRADGEDGVFGYTAASYRRHIERWCRRLGVSKWTPHRLRHNAATELRKQFGIEAARLVLGHAKAAVTELYAEIDRERAKQIVGDVG